MKNLYQLSDDLVNLVKTQFRFTKESKTINDTVMHYIDNVMLTKNKNYRYPKKYFTALNQVFYVTKKQLEDENVVFGYWHDRIFYTTNVNSKHKKLTELYVILKSSDLSKLKNGLYYESNIKPYYI